MTLKESREKKGFSRKPNLTVAKKLADALEMSLDDFICLSTFQNEI